MAVIYSVMWKASVLVKSIKVIDDYKDTTLVNYQSITAIKKFYDTAHCLSIK